MPVELMIRVIDAETRKVELYRESHSWTVQAMQLITAQFMQAHTATIRDTMNETRTWVRGTWPYLGTDAASGITTYGIVVGTGTGAEGPSNYALEALIAHGSAATQLNYGSMSYTQAFNESGTVSTAQSRMFGNASVSVTIKEVGLYMRSRAGITVRYFCVIRDVLGVDEFDIDIGESKFVEYILQTVN